ncbi:hypothetical protein SPRG_04884 [Saprolegnia parasitica CBS 223.65]|uniref:F5/8 type C domain-containing protein n=1 Tax=Saprolegnia parasitica (strain CBS 223.65) TaxID=695850 RepID=A0A067CSK3_SAPPC|nr:hypothetical protein SPRG_04884 [Saprolegnia parasitica CBS 223.65]KDO29767.1 hypothetical protein SPRG_04884 [Saprolegnia parasitica CBS 223.65]|eukprot:XP_012199415.1 hypothetical protein SPRG_04884 [Saprolegnia parasitica CBS 223.65]
MTLLVGPATPTTCRVSSVLNKDRTQYGAQNMFDGVDDTCWNSAQGHGQQVCLLFHRVVHVKRMELMFQGGFVGEDARVLIATQATPELHVATECHFNDSNELQTLELDCADVTQLRLQFDRSSDFYGRVLLYHCRVYGDETL